MTGGASCTGSDARSLGQGCSVQGLGFKVQGLGRRQTSAVFKNYGLAIVQYNTVDSSIPHGLGILRHPHSRDIGFLGSCGTSGAVSGGCCNRLRRRISQVTFYIGVALLKSLAGLKAQSWTYGACQGKYCMSPFSHHTKSTEAQNVQCVFCVRNRQAVSRSYLFDLKSEFVMFRDH